MATILRPLGVRPVIVGKTHMIPDVEGMEWLGIDPNSPIGVTIAECGFEPYERDDGLHPVRAVRSRTRATTTYLRRHGFDGRNPWEDWANSAEGDDGELLSGWLLRYNNLAGARPGRAFRDALHDVARDGLHRRSRRQAVALPSVLHQAALALYRAGAVSRHVRSQRHPAAGALRSRARNRSSGLSRLSEHAHLPGASRATKCASA